MLLQYVIDTPYDGKFVNEFDVINYLSGIDTVPLKYKEIVARWAAKEIFKTSQTTGEDYLTRFDLVNIINSFDEYETLSFNVVDSDVGNRVE